jgi:hypothetical protein
MKNSFLVLVLFLSFSFVSVGQTKYFSRNGKVVFKSDAPLEKIDAINKKASGVIDTESGAIQFSVLMKAFEFKKALMQEHFNENYVESSKFPKSTFKGVIKNNDEINWEKDGEYEANISGQMTLHGITKSKDVLGTIMIENGKLSGSTRFDILLSDYEIGIPKVVQGKISENVQVEVSILFEPLEK